MPSLQLYKTQNTQTSLWVLALILLLRGEANVNIIFSIFQLPVNPIQSGFVLFVENQKIEVLKRSETYWSIFSIHRWVKNQTLLMMKSKSFSFFHY